MEALYMKDCYLKEFEATVKTVSEGKYITLDKTAFYPNSGGQPCDTGKLIKDTKEYPVVYAGKFGGRISHEVTEPGLKEGDKVKGIIDWQRRHLFMRYHTACHILSAIIHNDTGAQITGNQIGEDKTRIDFSLESFDREKISSYEAKANEIIEKQLPVTIKFMKREEAFKIPSIVKLKMQLPESIKELRIVDIESLDQQACAGTHVKNTKEIGNIQILKAENKGKNNRRIYFRLE